MPGLSQTVPVTYFRGGTSKALFFHEKDVPREGPSRDRFLKRIMGSPDPLQIDGMGGSHLVTSKIAIIRPSERDDADVDYTFCQVGIDADTIGYGGNCGNISSAVGPFAIDEGLVKEFREGVSPAPNVPTREIRIFNTGTQKVLVSHVPIDESTGKYVESGEFSIDGCPGKGSAILMDYRSVSPITYTWLGLL
jgi:2-methylaconitate cis-trans-isomerase PrpF